MSRPFKQKTLRAKLEAQLSELAEQTDELRKQVADRVADRAPAVRDQLVGQTDELRHKVADRAPAVREQIIAALPDKGQLLHLRDDLFDRLPENVQDRLPEKVKPKRSKLRKVAAVGLVTGAGAAAFAILKRKGDAPSAYVPPVPPPAPAAPSAAPQTGTGTKS